jgi:hypothetical protein
MNPNPKNHADRLRNIAEVESTMVYNVVTLVRQQLVGTIGQVTDDDFVVTPPPGSGELPITVMIAAVSTLTSTGQTLQTYRAPGTRYRNIG